MNSEPLSDRKDRVLKALLIVTGALFIIMWILGTKGPVLIANDRCYYLLGCNSGFFGYDALQHFISGIMEAALFMWLARKIPAINPFHRQFWKNVLVVVTLAAFVGFVWEFGELCRDQFRMKVLHVDLIATNHLDQPTNDDTMGDMTFSILGAAITASLMKSYMQKEE